MDSRMKKNLLTGVWKRHEQYTEEVASTEQTLVVEVQQNKQEELLQGVKVYKLEEIEKLDEPVVAVEETLKQMEADLIKRVLSTVTTEFDQDTTEKFTPSVQNMAQMGVENLTEDVEKSNQKVITERLEKLYNVLTQKVRDAVEQEKEENRTLEVVYTEAEVVITNADNTEKRVDAEMKKIENEAWLKENDEKAKRKKEARNALIDTIYTNKILGNLAKNTVEFNTALQAIRPQVWTQVESKIVKVKLYRTTYDVKISEKGMTEVEFVNLLDGMDLVLNKSVHKSQGDFEGFKVIMNMVSKYPIMNQTLEYFIVHWNKLAKQKMKVL